MKRMRSVRASVVLVACVGLLFPPSLWAEAPIVAPPGRSLDVTLHEAGLLIGQLVDSQGRPMPRQDVTLSSATRALATTKTDALGRYAIKGLSRGVYRLSASGVTVPVRVWDQASAPPKASFAALIVAGSTVRGQCKTCNSGASTGYAASYAPDALNGAAHFNATGQTAYAGHSVGPAAHFNNGGGAVVMEGAGGYAGGGPVGGGGFLGSSFLSAPWIVGGGVVAAAAVALGGDDAS